MNNACIDASGTKVAELSIERWHKALVTNVDGYFFCSRRFIQHRPEKIGKGKIIKVTSIYQRVPRASGRL